MTIHSKDLSTTPSKYIRLLQRKRTNRIYIYERKRFILKNWLMRVWGLAILKYVEQASSLETWARVDVAVLRPKSAS